jgi:hypothetical protein
MPLKFLGIVAPNWTAIVVTVANLKRYLREGTKKEKKSRPNRTGMMALMSPNSIAATVLF